MGQNQQKHCAQDNAHHNVYPYMETHNFKVNGAFTQMTHYTQCDVIFTFIDYRYVQEKKKGRICYMYVYINA